ncbi:HNH endonuclease [Photobacterium makurazakiensis]|uniref:HNH endonuclease n=1 Tax=Photobacterium makurazakiensis TaxID=2910234 RepID=UPI003D0B4A9A
MIQPVQFDEEQLAKIKEKISDKAFSGESWSDDDIENIKKTIKTHYLDIQKTTCPYCRQKIKSRHGRYWDIEHVIPRSTVANFMFEPLNLCMSCVDCNGAKSNKKVTNSTAKIRYPKKSSDYLIIHPHFDDYDENIIIIKEGFYYVAKKKKGAKTIEVCSLNRFYEFAEFGADADDDDRIFLLSDQLRNTDNPDIKKVIRREIAALAIKGAA